MLQPFENRVPLIYLSNYIIIRMSQKNSCSAAACVAKRSKNYSGQ